MEDIRSKQLEVLGEAKDYCIKVLHSIDTVIPELIGANNAEPHEYLRLTVHALNNTLEMYNPTPTLVKEHSDIDETEVNKAVEKLGAALKGSVDKDKAAALEDIKDFIRAYGEAAKNITEA